MKPMEILDAMNGIDNKHIQSAESKLGYLQVSGTCSKSRRFLISLTAAILILTATMVTVLAASEEFRTMFFSFFRIETPAVVPESDPNHTEGQMDVVQENVDIGGVIEGTYIHFPGMSHARNGFYMVCTDEVIMNSGNHYDAYVISDGTFLKLESDHFCQDYHIFGNTVRVEFDWSSHNGEVCLTYVNPEVPFRKPGFSGSEEAALFTLSVELPGGQYTNYPVLLNLRTGELTDICRNLGLETLPGIYQAAISDDHSKLLLVTWEKEIYYADLVKGQLYSLSDLIGAAVEEASLIDDHITCWTLEKGGYNTGYPDSYRAWTIDLNTMESRELFSHISPTGYTSYNTWIRAYDIYQDPDLWAAMGAAELDPATTLGLYFLEGFNMTSHWGNMYAGSRFALLVDSARSVFVVDLITCETSRIQGFLWPYLESPFIEWIPSPDGEKLLIYTRSGSVFDSVGVLDFTEKSYTTFSRENLSDVTEHMAYWFDNDSIIITARTPEDNTDYYLYKLTP